MSKTLETLRKKAAELFEQEKYGEIIELLTDEVLEKYKDAILYAWRARAHNSLKQDGDVSMGYAQKAIEADSNYNMGFFARGGAWTQKNELEKAIADFTKSIELKPDYTTAYNSRGNVWGKIGQHDKSIEDYSKAIEFNSGYYIAFYNRGIAWNSKGEHDKAIADYGKAIELKPDYIKAYIERGNVYFYKGEYKKAIKDYSKVIELKPDHAVVYYNRGLAFNKKGEYEKAIEDYTKAIELKPDNADAYNNRGSIWFEISQYDKAVEDYNKAIQLKPDYAYAYYGRGNTKRLNSKDFDGSIKDFEQYLKLAADKDDIWVKRAKDIIEELQEKIKDNELKEIGDLTSKIKKLLLITTGCITHYTGLSVTKKLIFDGDTKFRISEGAFLNDTSEGTELFKFLQYQFATESIDGLLAQTFAPKPFIGSFVAENKHDDLNLWRFYGKENGVEAKGCALTIRMKEFIEAINFSLTKGDLKPGAGSEDDINFYRVAYWDHDAVKPNFQIPNSSKKDERALIKLMDDLKNKVTNYKAADKSILEKYLNSIAFLFKSDAYKNENEIRLVVKGIEFDKHIDMEANPPRVYIELINIRHLIEQITLGPKVDKPDEWAAAFYYCYDKETDKKRTPNKILISRLPYK